MGLTAETEKPNQTLGWCVPPNLIVIQVAKPNVSDVRTKRVQKARGQAPGEEPSYGSPDVLVSTKPRGSRWLLHLV